MTIANVLADVTWMAVLVATVAAFALGALWYSKALFGNAWMQEVGLDDDAINSAGMGRILGLTFVLQLISATALSSLLGTGSNWYLGLQAGLWIGLFWVLTAYGVTYLFEQRSTRLWLINGGYFVACFALMGTVLGAWP